MLEKFFERDPVTGALRLTEYGKDATQFSFNRATLENICFSCKDKLDKMALVTIRKLPELIDVAWAVRRNKIVVNQIDADELVRVGVFRVDRNGYYLADVMEDFIDEIEASICKHLDLKASSCRLTHETIPTCNGRPENCNCGKGIARGVTNDTEGTH